MPARTRTLYASHTGTSVLDSGNPVYRTWATLDAVCNDVTTIDHVLPNPLEILRGECKGGRLSGWKRLGSQTTVFNEWPLLKATRNVTYVLSATDPKSAVNRTLAQSGPLTPRVNLPLFVYELKDVPKMLKHLGDLYHKIRNRSTKDPLEQAASNFLGIQFGWKPLIEDLWKLVRFGDAVKKRQSDIRKANSKGGLRRRIRIDSKTIVTNGKTVLKSDWGIWVEPKWQSTESLETWTTVRWVTRDTSQIGKDPSWVDAFRAALGLNLGHIPITVWKALPWSWMIDWFADISNVLLANYNSLYYKPGSVCYMSHRTMKTVYEGLTLKSSSSDLFFTEGTVERYRKVRNVHPPNIHARIKLPFLDDFKLSILGSLAILRLKNAAR